jgi:sugar lactone lactonase YvrE
MKIKLKQTIQLNAVLMILAVIIPFMVWGLVSCGSKNAPVSPSGTIGLNVSMQTSGLAKSALLGAASNEVYYSITGPAMSPVTGVTGPITTAASSGTINLSLAIPQGSARLMAFQINDASNHQPLALGAVQMDVSSQPSSQVVIEMGSLVRNCYNQNTSAFLDGSFFSFGNGTLADAATIVSTAPYDVQFIQTAGVFQMYALNGASVAYMGNGNLVNFAMAPANGAVTASAASKQAAGAAVTTLQAGDVYCFYLPNPSAHLWVQITNTGSTTAGPSFVFRGNTTLPYYAYQQTPADLAGPCATPVPPAAYNYVYSTQWGSAGTGPSLFSGLWSVALDSSNNVYVVDETNNYVQTFTSSGTFITQWGASGTGTGQFSAPQGIAVDSSGNVYVSDFNNNRIQKFTSSGTFITSWGVAGAALGQFNLPRGLAVDGSGNVYASDGTNGHVLVFNSGGTYLYAIGTPGTGSGGQMTIAWGVAVDTFGNVYVADGNNYRIEKFTTSGTFITEWGSFGTGNGQFNQNYGVTTDSAGYVYVADRANNRVQKFDSNGNYLTQWGVLGANNGQLNQLSDLKLDSAGNVYVADNANNRVEVFKP